MQLAAKLRYHLTGLTAVRLFGQLYVLSLSALHTFWQKVCPVTSVVIAPKLD